MRGRRRWVLGLSVLALTCALACALVGVPAYGVGTGNPAVTAPAPTAKHYAGYTGPFTVSFEDAPIADYDWYVEQVPAGGGSPVQVTSTRTFAWSGSGASPQLRSSPLPAGESYQFRVTDNAGHETTFGFAVLPGPAPACSIQVPAQVRVNAPVERITGRLASGCAALHTDWAAWKVQHVVHGYADLFYFDGTTSDVWSYYDDEPTGTYAITPNGARSTDQEDVPQNTRRTVVRMDSRLVLAGHRAGGATTLSATLRRYLPSANGFRPWSSRRVALFSRTCGTCAWHRVAVRSTARLGVATFRLRTHGVREYRISATGTASTWAPRPKSLRR